MSEENDTDSVVKRQKKIAVSFRSLKHLLIFILRTQISQVSIDSAATNDDLAKEVADYLHREPNTFTLELPGGFELRGQE